VQAALDPREEEPTAIGGSVEGAQAFERIPHQVRDAAFAVEGGHLAIDQNVADLSVELGYREGHGDTSSSPASSARPSRSTAAATARICETGGVSPREVARAP